MKGLTAWEWPGNIRELENFIERAVILTRGKALQVPLTELRKTETEMAVDAVVNKKRAARKAFSSGPDINAGAEEYERKQREEIIQALSACKGRVGGTDGAAIRLGISRTTLIYRMRRLESTRSCIPDWPALLSVADEFVQHRFSLTFSTFSTSDTPNQSSP